MDKTPAEMTLAELLVALDALLIERKHLLTERMKELVRSLDDK